VKITGLSSQRWGEGDGGGGYNRKTRRARLVRAIDEFTEGRRYSKTS